MKRLIALLTLLILLVAAPGAMAAPPNATTPCGTTPTPTVYDHWIVIVEENHSRSQTIGHMPYLDGLLAKCGEATMMTATQGPPNGSGGHVASSLANYIAMTSGDVQKNGGGTFIADCLPSPSCETSRQSVFGQVGASQTWGFMESMTSNCKMTNNTNYAARHNPELYYTGDRTGCLTNNLPLTSFQAKIDAGTLRKMNYVIPNLQNDMHDGTIAAADAWLALWMPRILNGPNYNAGDTVVVVTWDEPALSAPISTPIETVVIAPSTPVGKKAGTAFDHYSMLRTQELELGVPFLGHAAEAVSWRTAFNL